MSDLPVEITVEDLKRMRDEGEAHTLLDVREQHELELIALSGSLDIPVAQVPERIAEIPKELPIAVLCRTGNRSMKVTQWLRANGYENSTNVGGGVNAWAERIDTSLTPY